MEGLYLTAEKNPIYLGEKGHWSLDKSICKEKTEKQKMFPQF